MTAKNRTRTRRSAPAWLTTERAIIFGTIGVSCIILLVFGARLFQNSYNRNLVIEGVEFIPAPIGQHVTTQVDYPQTPPAGGPHNPVWQDCGVYDDPIANEYAVHSLEHGAVWITYRPDLPAQQIAYLADITRQSDHRLLSPYPGIDSPVIVSAWGYQVRLQSFDDPRLMQFILKYESGPTTPEQGGLCSGGVDLTLSQLAGGS